MSFSIYVSNLHKYSYSAGLKRKIEYYDIIVKDVRVIGNKGYGFIDFYDKYDMEYIMRINKAYPIRYKGRRLVFDYSLDCTRNDKIKKIFVKRKIEEEEENQDFRINQDFQVNQDFRIKEEQINQEVRYLDDESDWYPIKHPFVVDKNKYDPEFNYQLPAGSYYNNDR